MVDKKIQFVLSLQGKKYAGHLDQWSITDGDLAGIGSTGEYQLTARGRQYEIIDNKYAISEHSYVTLGKQHTHKEIVEIYASKTKREYDPDDEMGHAPYKTWD